MTKLCGFIDKQFNFHGLAKKSNCRQKGKFRRKNKLWINLLIRGANHLRMTLKNNEEKNSA